VVAGGADLYAQLLPRCHRLHLTLVHGRFEADTWWPVPLEALAVDWRETAREDVPADDRHCVPMTFLDLARR
jgi:dihydrofolate reductase